MRIMLVLSAILLSACGKSDDGSSSSSSDGGGGGSNTSANAPASAEPWEDSSKPYLDDKKMGNFVASLKDKNGPFEAVSKGKVTAFNVGERMDEFDAAARKAGFKSGAEYMGVWTRINSANTVVMMQESNQSMIKMQEETLKNQQEMLKNPDATPEMRKGIEESIKGTKEAIEALKKSNMEGVNADDVAAFKKHRAEFEEAMKGWNK